MEKMAWDGPKWGQEDLFPTNSERILILIIFMILICCFPNFWKSRFPDLQNLARARLGPGRAGLEPSGPKNIDCLQ